MTSITREQAKKIIEAADEVISALAGTNEDVHPGSDNMLRLWDDLNDRYAPPEVVRELARIVLASLEAEPIGAFHIAEQQVDGTSDYLKDGEWPIDNGIIEVYAAPPVPVVPEEKPMPNALSMLEREITQLIGDAQEATVTGYELIAEAWRLMDGQDPKTSDWHSKASKYLNSNIVEKVDDDRIEAVKAVLRRLAGNSPVIPGEVLSAIMKVARVRADFDDFDGDRRGVGDCLDEAEQELIVTINKYASQLAAEPIATNNVREQQTAVPPVPEIQDDVAQAIENLKQKLVECNRYNYCADAVKGVEDASRVLALQNQNMSAPVTPEAIENAIEYIRSIAFHIDEDDYHGKHIAYFMRQALVWLEGHSCSDDRQGKAENQPVRVNQAAESNRGNEWTGNPDIDNAIIMLDRIDTLENCDDDRIEGVKAVLRRLAGTELSGYSG